jgi:hypothetical protein
MMHHAARAKWRIRAAVVLSALVAIGSLALQVGVRTPSASAAAASNSPGYWLVAADGGVYPYRTASYGSTRGKSLHAPIVGSAPTPSGRGYWLVASDGGVFSFGDARFHGSTGGMRLNRPIVGMAVDEATGGYWLVASDGGVFSFGAPFYGSTGSIRLNQPIVGMAASATGGGYWLAARDGGVFAFHVPFLGSTGGAAGPAPVVSITSTGHGYPFPSGSTGFDVSVFQCGTSLPARKSFAIVQVAGAINGARNPCYQAEAAWAAPNMSAYIFMDGLPSPAPPEARTGPAGTCNGNVTCQSFNFGWDWARHWISFSRSAGVNAFLWWLDVETDGVWRAGAVNNASNAQVIAGAVAGVRSMGEVAGIYSTTYQWGQITGSLVDFPAIPLWVPGGGNISTGTFAATRFCSQRIANYEPFAGGIVTLVQYGYALNGYSGPTPLIDLDYACA